MPHQKLVNFRDVSAHINLFSPVKLKKNQLFRSADLCFAKPKDLYKAFEHYKIKTYIDFRQGFEQERSGISPILSELNIQHIHLPIDTYFPAFQELVNPEVENWVELYNFLYGSQTNSWMQYIHHLLQAPLNIVYGCSAGKDRTGIATAILLTLLGVKKDLILQDFSLTTDHLVSNSHYYSYLWEENPSRTQESVVEHFLKAKPGKLGGFLDHRGISREQLMMDLALTHDDIKALQQRFM